MMKLSLICLFAFTSPILCSAAHSAETISPVTLAMNDSLSLRKRRLVNDSVQSAKKEDLQLNNEAVKLIQFDFMPSHAHEQEHPKVSPMNKPWMDFQVDLSVPKNLIDTTRVRKPEKYIRMLPYSIWTRFGEDPVYDVLVFGNKKRLELMLKFDFDGVEEFGRNMKVAAGSYDPNPVAGNASVVIQNLDFIGFLYDNLNKQGRIRKHNRKHANAWKTYQQAAPALSDPMYAKTDSVSHQDEESYSEALPGLQHHLKSIELIEEKTPKYFEHPDYRLLQTPEQRSRFGTFYDPELYALPSSAEDSVAQDSLETTRRSQKEYEKKRTRRRRKIRKEVPKKDDGILEELPNSMDELYRYIHAKQEQDSLKRKEMFRKDKDDKNAFELEQQQRRLKERQN